MSRSDFPPLDKSFTGTLQDISERIDRQARRRQRLVVPVRGTTAERDIAYPPPGVSVPDQVALANRQVNWYNTDTGWEESYYAVTGLSGLTARGLIAGTASGWYPTGLGPYCVLQPPGVFNATSGNYVRNWSSATDQRRGGAGWFTYNAATGLMQIKVAGTYDLSFWTSLQSGVGTANFILQVPDAGGTVQRAADGNAFTLNSGMSVVAHAKLDSLQVAAGWQLGAYLYTGALDVHNVPQNPRAQLKARYMGPALVFD